MVDQIRQYLEPFPAQRKYNALREYLQWLILKIMDSRHFRKSMDFVGGTALRIIYQNNRFSEDLDFSLAGRAALDFSAIAATIQRDLSLYGLRVEAAALKETRTVASCFFRFSGLLAPLGIAPMDSQKISIKIEVDQNPPPGGVAREYFFNGPLLFSVNHYDLSSLFSGKLHALLFRNYAKGRDYYDLMFYLRKKCGFNFDLFKNAARQTHPELDFPDAESVLEKLKNTLEKMDDAKIRLEVAPFLLAPEELPYVDSKHLLMALAQNREAGVFSRSS